MIAIELSENDLSDLADLAEEYGFASKEELAFGVLQHFLDSACTRRIPDQKIELLKAYSEVSHESQK